MVYLAIALIIEDDTTEPLLVQLIKLVKIRHISSLSVFYNQENLTREP
jgi:hypothetical protein